MGRLLTRLEDPSAGFVFFQGRDIAPLEGEDLKVFRRNIQMVFQDPYESLNPRTTVLQTVMEPLINHYVGATFEEKVKLCVKALEDAGLAPAKEYLNRFPHELSGGQRQRVAIARALVIDPRVVVADEPVSMLDVSIRAGVLNLMLDLRDKYHIPYLFITHDIAVARYVSDRLAVMYLGKIVEIGETDAVIFKAKHPYTQALLSAVPVPDPEHKHGRIRIKGEIPSAIDLPLGCRFRPRCPSAFRICGWEASDLVDFLVLEDKMEEAEHPMSKHVDGLHPEGFSMLVDVKPGGSSAAIEEFLTLKAEELKSTRPMFEALGTVGRMAGDKQIVIRCASSAVPGKWVARELLELVTEAVEFRNSDHPMYGIIMNARADGEGFILEVGEGKVHSTVAFLEDFVRRYRKLGHPEFRGVTAIAGDESVGTVVATCGPGPMPAKRVAEEVMHMVETDFELGRKSPYYNLLLPLRRRGGKVIVRVLGPDDRWDKLAADLKSFLRRKTKAVTDVRVETVKGPRDVVVAKFIRSEQPPLIDAGGGHRVACYLYKPVAG